MKHILFAHAGEHHETATEAAEHAAQSVTISTSLLFWLALIVIPIIIALVFKACRAKLSTTLLVISTFLIVFSVVSYQQPGLYSVLSLSIGFAIVFLLSIIGLSAKE
jgi:heme/copper-type cytochrome/quinol oxidase subunit 2